jgi:hypothetical protein
MRNASLFHDCVRRVARQDFAADGKVALRDGTEPDFVIAFAAANHAAAMLSQDALHITSE